MPFTLGHLEGLSPGLFKQTIATASERARLKAASNMNVEPQLADFCRAAGVLSFLDESTLGGISMNLFMCARLGLPLALLLSTSQTANVEWKPDAKIDGYETYTWIDGTPAANKLSHQRIVSSVENELAIRGWWRADQDPDVYLSYYASEKDEVVIDYTYRTDWYDDASVTVRRIHEGTLMLDIIDVAEEELVWRGITTETLSDNPRRNDSKISDTVRRLLAEFPPE